MDDDTNRLLQQIFALTRPFTKGAIREERVHLHPNLYAAFDAEDNLVAFYGEPFRQATAKLLKKYL